MSCVTAEAPVDVSAAASGLDHYICCRDENRTFCGVPGDALVWAEFEIASCVVCEDVHRSVPLGSCPFGGVCEGRS